MSNDEKKTETTINPEKKEQEAIIPIPERAQKELNAIVQSNANVQLHGEAKKIFKYISYNGEWTFCTCLYEKITVERVNEEKIKEKYLPYYYTNEGWIAGRPDIDHLPLYHENLLKGNENPVLIVSNEKLANIKVDDYIVISPVAGLANIIGSLEYLKNRRIIVWPTGNIAGIKLLKEFIPEAEILSVKKNWSLQDAVNEKIDIRKFIKNSERVRETERERIDLEKYYDPHDTFHIIRKDLYGDENLEQLDGIFYFYDENKHFWQERLEISIKSDIQKWIDENYCTNLKDRKLKIHTFIGNVKSFLPHFSRKYYTVNPFKRSALHPFIHVRNGAIEITEGGFIFHRREEKGESFFRELHPLHCLEFDFEMKYYKENNLQEYAPAFYHYMKHLIPRYLTKDKEKYQKELSLTIDFFSQVIAYCLSPIKRKPRFFAMYGGQGTGKSFFIDVLRTIIGEEFFVERPIKHMQKEFSSFDLWNSKIYVDDDVKSNVTLPDDFIKGFTGQKSITAEGKNKTSVKGVRISIAMFFISNHAFTVSGGVEGIERRFIYIPYREKIKEMDTYLLDKIIGERKKGRESGKHKGSVFDERPAIIGLALRGIDLFVRNNHEFVMPEWISLERKDWIVQSNTITQFLYEVIYPGEHSKWNRKEIYNEYKDWCKEEDRHMYGRNNFYEKLRLEERIEFKHTFDGDIIEIELDNPDKEKWKLEDLPI